MSDAALEFAEEHGLGQVRARVRLDSGLAIAGGARSRAHLLFSESGLWLVAARDRLHGQHLDLLTRGDLRLVAGRVRDRLCFGQEALLIPAGRRAAVERLIALARFDSAKTSPRPPLASSWLIQEPDELGRAWLSRDLSHDEILVAWLPGSNLVTVRSQLIGDTRCTPHLFVTERRAAIVVWSAVGDVSYVPLEPSTVRARAEGDKLELSSDMASFVSRRGGGQACRDAFELLAHEASGARLLEAARRSWLGGDRGRGKPNASLALLEAASERGDQKAPFARLLALAELSHGGTEIAADAVELALRGSNLAPPLLGDLWLGFQFSEEAGSSLVRALLELGAPAFPFAFALQRRIHPTAGADPAVARDELRLVSFAVEARLASTVRSDPRDLALAEVLRRGGLARRASAVSVPKRAVSTEQIESTLTHPLARGQTSLVASVQKLIALSPEPDHAALSDYCEALDSNEEPGAKRVLDAARLAFSLPQLRAYVSRGKKSIGMRGYEGEAPYILLGSAHLDAASPFYMTEAELAFAIGSEALHLKLGQARLTSSEVWAGALARTKGGVELALGLLPLLRGLPVAASVAKVLDKLPEPALRRGLETLLRFGRSPRRDSAEPDAALGALSHINENLVTAHRLMQMSADRAGLLLSGDLRASVRGLLLVRPDTRALLEAMVEGDLVSVLLGSEIEPALFRDLLVRVAALLQFFVGDEYLALRRVLHAS